MNLDQRLRALVALADPDGTVTVRWLAALLEEPTEPTPSPEVLLDLTVRELAANLRRGESTVRTWLARGDLPGSYRLHGREWRIPRAALDALRHCDASRQRRRAARITGSAEHEDLRSWRKHLRTGAPGRRSLDATDRPHPSRSAPASE